MDDVLRDEKSRIRRLNASIVRKTCAMRLPTDMELLVRQSSKELEKIEGEGVGLDEYVEHLSTIGGKIVSHEAKKEDERKYLWGLGSSIVATLTLRDMMRDLKSDVKNGAFNPLKNCPFQAAIDLLRQYHLQLSSYVQMRGGLFMMGPRGGGACAGWSQMMYCYMICEMVYEELGVGGGR
ncbi:MAG: DUF5685 family protein [Nitrososphaerales archaeon]